MAPVNIGGKAGGSFPGEDKDSLSKLVILRDLPKARYATRPAVTIYPSKGRGKPTVFSHLEIYKLVENVAQTLRENGVRPKTMVAFALPNGIESVVTFFALQWVNAIAVSVDPALGKAGISPLLKSVGASIIITPHVDEEDRSEDAAYQDAEALAADLGACSWHVKYSMNEGVKLDTHSNPYGPPAWRGGSSDYTVDPLEVSIYTFSPGSKLPLILRLTHQNVAAAAKAFARTYELFDNDTASLQSKSKTLLTEGLSDVQGILLLVTSFYVGGKIVIPPRGEFVPADLWTYVEADDISWASVDCAQFLELYESSKTKRPAEKQISFVRVCGGGFLDVNQQASYEQVLGCPVLESYGPPEASGIVTSETFVEDMAGTLGKAVQGCSVRIFATGAVRTMLDPNQEGDIAVRGDNVTTGFLNDEAENAESVVKVTTADGVVEDWFCTGDRGEIDEEGHLRLTGSARGIRAEERMKRAEEREREAEMAALAAAEQKQQAEAASRDVDPSAEVTATSAATLATAPGISDGRERLNRNWNEATQTPEPGEVSESAPGQVRKPDWLLAEEQRAKQMRPLTLQDIQNVGPDWCIVTPFLGIPAEDEKVVVMRRVPSGQSKGSDPVVEIDDLPEGSQVEETPVDAATAASVAAAAAVATYASDPSQESIPSVPTEESQVMRRLQSRSASEALVADSTAPQVKKKVVKFGGVTYEYFYTDEDDEEMLLELLGDASTEEEKKRTVRLPPKYCGGYYTEDIEDNERIQVRVMTSKEATQFRRSLEQEFLSKLEAEKKRLREEYDELLAAALRQQEEDFKSNHCSNKEQVVETFNKQFDAAAEKQKEEVMSRLLADSKERENVYNQLLKEQGDKDVAEALTKLQEKRADDRAVVLGSVLLAKKELEEGIHAQLDDEFEKANEDLQAANGVGAEEQVEQQTEETMPRSASTVDRLGVVKQPGILTYMDDPEKLEQQHPETDPELLQSMRTIAEEEKNLYRSSVVADADTGAVAAMRGIEDKHLNDKMSYIEIVKVLEELDASQRSLEEKLLYANREQVFKARELAEALTEERTKMEKLSSQLATEAFEATSSPVLTECNLEGLEASVLDAAASAEEGRAATIQAVLAVRRATEFTKQMQASAVQASAAANSAALAATRATDMTDNAANRAPAAKETVYREIMPDQVVSETVKKKFVKIDLRKIDETLKKHPSVLDARAFTIPSKKTGSEVHAVVQVKKGARTSEAWLKQFMQQSMPLSMAPRKYFYTLKPIPAGRKALAWSPDLIPFSSDYAPKFNYIPPRRIIRPSKEAQPAPPSTAV